METTTRTYLMGMLPSSDKPRTLATYAAAPTDPIKSVAWQGRAVAAWWLVEAESADAARAIIESGAGTGYPVGIFNDDGTGYRVRGRILASGGQP